MVVNDDAGGLNARGGPAFFASMLAPTGKVAPAKAITLAAAAIDPQISR